MTYKVKKMINRPSIFIFLGNFIFLASQWLMTIAAARILNFQEVGNLSIAITLANICYMISIYGIRPFQVSDVTNEYSDEIYLHVRVITSLIGFFICIFILIIFNYPAKQFVVVIAYMAYKTLEALSDHNYACFQNAGRFDWIIVSMASKGVLQLTGFVIGLILARNLLVGILISTGTLLVLLVFYDFPRMHYSPQWKLNWTTNLIKSSALLRICFPLFLSSLFYPLFQAIPRIYFEKTNSTESFGLYSAVATPSIIILVMTSSIILPIIPKITRLYNDYNQKGVIQTILIANFLTILLGGIACGIIYIYGNNTLIWFFGDRVKNQQLLLILVLISVTISALVVCFGSVFIAARKMNVLMMISAIGCLVGALLTPYFIHTYGSYGIALTLITGQFVQLLVSVLFFTSLIVNLRPPSLHTT